MKTFTDGSAGGDTAKPRLDRFGLPLVCNNWRGKTHGDGFFCSSRDPDQLVVNLVQQIGVDEMTPARCDHFKKGLIAFTDLRKFILFEKNNNRLFRLRVDFENQNKFSSSLTSFV